MTFADQRFVTAFASFLHQEIGKAVSSKCVYAVSNPFSGRPGRDAFYAATTDTSIVCGYFLYSNVALLPFRDRWKTWDHRFRSIEKAEDRNLFQILGLNSAIVFEPEKRKFAGMRDSGDPNLYLQVGEHEKMFHESAVFESHVVNKFTRQLEERVTQILQDTNAGAGG